MPVIFVAAYHVGRQVRQRNGRVAAMDADYFLQERTTFIRFFYDQGIQPFVEICRKIEGQEPPFDDPPYSEDPEPAFLKEWMDAQTAVEVHGQSCVLLLSDSLKLYFETLRTRIIGFEWGKTLEAVLKAHGFVAAYKSALGEILQTDWNDCPVRFNVIEQVVLARNRGQHGASLTTLNVWLDGRTLTKHPFPFFTTDLEMTMWKDAGGKTDTLFFAPRLKVTRENLFEAIEEIEKLVDWVEGRMDKAWEWRRRQSSAETSA